MRDIDRALARAYAHRGTAEGSAVPPPHLATQSGGPSAHSPHLVVESEPRSRSETAILHWPTTIRALERAHGDRFERFADALIEARDRRGLKVLLFTSCHRAEGRTTLVLTLARALARRPGRTLLVDADLAGPMLARQLGLRPDRGLDDVLDRDVALADALIDAPDDHLSVLPLRAAVARPRVASTSPAWSCVLSRLRRDFDLVLLDGGPLFAGLSSPVPHRSVDAAILVHNRALTGERDLLRARETLDADGIPLLGLAETFV